MRHYASVTNNGNTIKIDFGGGKQMIIIHDNVPDIYSLSCALADKLEDNPIEMVELLLYQD